MIYTAAAGRQQLELVQTETANECFRFKHFTKVHSQPMLMLATREKPLKLRKDNRKEWERKVG